VIRNIHAELLLPNSEFVQRLPFYLKVLPSSIISWLLRNSSSTSNTEAVSRDKLKITKQHTLLTKALVANEEEAGLSDEIIIKECKAFIVAGTDTTAVTTSYLIWAVLKHLKVKARLQEELDCLSTSFSITDVQSLKYLHCVINETLRLYGAVLTSLRRTTPRGGRQLDGYFIPEKTTVDTQAFTLHRDPEIFEDPDKYV
jgi:cytochrome P450